MIRNTPEAVVRQTLLTAVFLLASPASLGACKSEMRILADDLAGLEFNAYQTQSIANKVLQAPRHCWVHREAAIELINSARRIAGLKETTGEFDWENVPLESLEERN